MMRAAGIILCGGRSSRMGQPKAWLELRGEYLLNRVVGILADHLAPIVVAAAPDQRLPPLSVSVRVSRDAIEGAGPLHGLAAAVGCLGDDADRVYVSACDVPLLQSSVVRCLLDSLGEFDVVVPSIAGMLQPLAAVYRVASLQRVLPSMLAQPRAGLRDLFPLLSTRILDEAELRLIDANGESFASANTPDEWRRLTERVNGST